jgi:hypothetical protein
MVNGGPSSGRVCRLSAIRVVEIAACPQPDLHLGDVRFVFLGLGGVGAQRMPADVRDHLGEAELAGVALHDVLIDGRRGLTRSRLVNHSNSGEIFATFWDWEAVRPTRECSG